MKLSDAALVAAFIVALAAASPALAGKPGTAAAVDFSAAQAEAGAKEYAENCSRCHGAQLQGITAPALKGGASGLDGDTVSEGYTFVSTQMPAGAPGSLTAKQYTDIFAFILKQNGHAAGSAALTPASAKASKTKV